MFIGRRLDGSVYGMWTSPQPDDADHPNIEEVQDDHPDVVAFVNRPQLDRRAVLSSAIDSAQNMTELKAAVKQALGL